MSGFAEQWAEAVKAADAEGLDWEPDDGDYVVEVATASTEVTKNGTELARLRLRIVDGPHAGGGFDHPLFFGSEFAMRKSIEALRAYGLALENVKEFRDLDRELKMLVGTEADIAVEHDGGYLRVRVDGARPPVEPVASGGTDEAVF